MHSYKSYGRKMVPDKVGALEDGLGHRKRKSFIERKKDVYATATGGKESSGCSQRHDYLLLS